MQTIAQIKELDAALKTKNKVEGFGIHVVVSGCNHKGYVLQVAPRYLEAAKQALNSTEVIQ